MKLQDEMNLVVKRVEEDVALALDCLHKPRSYEDAMDRAVTADQIHDAAHVLRRALSRLNHPSVSGR